MLAHVVIEHVEDGRVVGWIKHEVPLAAPGPVPLEGAQSEVIRAI